MAATSSDLKAALQDAKDKLSSIQKSNPKNWRSFLLQASWRGIEFEVLDSKLGGSQRNARHEFPKRKKSFVEAMGPGVEQYTINAYVIGDNYFYARDRLIEACREPGAGTLCDPFMGEVEAVCDSWEKTESIAEGRMAVFALTFSDAGQASELTAVETLTVGALLSDYTNALDELAKNVAADLDLVAQPARLITSAIRKIRTAIELAYQRIKNAALGVVGAYSDLFQTFLPSSSGAGSISAETLAQIQSAFEAIGQLEDLLALASTYDDLPFDAPVDPLDAPSAQTATRNSHRIDQFFQASYTLQAARVAAQTKYGSYDDAITARDEVVKRLIAIGKHDLAGDLFRYLTEVADDLAHLATYDVKRPSSTLELAQLFYGDATRADEIRLRNRVEHPGFILGESLKVLSE